MTTTVTPDLFALERVARAAADEGYYNVALLCRAAAQSLANRALHGVPLPKTPAALAGALADLEPLLAAAGLDPALLAALGRARARVAAGRPVLAADVPPVYVCRVCGAVTLGAAPGVCRECGAGPLVAQHLLPTFYLEPQPVGVLLEQLAAAPDWLAGLLAGLSEAGLDRAVGGAEGTWTLRDAAAHLLGAHDLLARRVQLFLADPAPDLVAAAPTDVTAPMPPTGPEIVARFRAARAALLATLAAAAPDLWARQGRHTEFGPVTLQQTASYFAAHEQWHRAQMERMRKAL